jgi:hypothetical protein
VSLYAPVYWEDLPVSGHLHFVWGAREQAGGVPIVGHGMSAESRFLIKILIINSLVELADQDTCAIFAICVGNESLISRIGSD